MDKGDIKENRTGTFSTCYDIVPFANSYDKAKNTVQHGEKLTEKSDSSTTESNLSLDVEGETVLLDTEVSVSGRKNHNLKLTSDGVRLTPLKEQSKKKQLWDDGVSLKILWRDVLRVEEDQSLRNEHQRVQLTLHFIDQSHRKKMVPQHLYIEVPNDGTKELICSLISEHCANVAGRPRKLFVIINPIGGNGNGIQTFETKVAPLLELAHVETTVLITKKYKHALEIGEKEDFSNYDGILLVGGDGLYQEVLQGLLLRLQREAGVEYDDPDVELVKPDIPIGIIPAGTGNAVVRWCNDGVIDVVTSTLRLLQGERHRAQVLTVHSSGKLVAVCGLMCCTGLISDMTKRTEELRWMRRMRYLYCFAGLFFKKARRFDCTVEYCLSGNDEDSSKKSEQALEWKQYNSRGKSFVGINSFVGEYERVSERHVVVDPFTANPVIQVFLDTGTSVFSLIKFLNAQVTGNYYRLPLNYDVINNVCRYRFKMKTVEGETDPTESPAGAEGPVGAESPAREKRRVLERLFNVDGELLELEQPEMDLRVHAAVIPLYACRLSRK